MGGSGNGNSRVSAGKKVLLVQMETRGSMYFAEVGKGGFRILTDASGPYINGRGEKTKYGVSLSRWRGGEASPLMPEAWNLGGRFSGIARTVSSQCRWEEGSKKAAQAVGSPGRLFSNRGLRTGRAGDFVILCWNILFRTWEGGDNEEIRGKS